MTTTYASSSPAAVAESARASLRGLQDVLWAAKSPEELLDTVRSIERLKSTLESIELAVVNEIDATDAAKVDGWASTKDFVTDVAGTSREAGAAAVRLARGLAGDYVATGEALAAGSISRMQASIITRALDKLPVKPTLRHRGEELLLAEASALNAADLQKLADHVIARLDPDGDERRDEAALKRMERSAHLNRFLSIRPDGAGGVRIKGRTTVEDAAVVKAALMPLAAPDPADSGACAGAGACPVAGCAHDGRDRREHGARFLDALVEGCQRLLDTGDLPRTHGCKPRITITMALTDLLQGLGTGALDTGDTLSATAVRRLACDADLIPAVLGAAGEVLDVGRQQRLASTAIRKALILRDGHCRFPGCSRPPIACDAHHIVSWLDGGATSLDNLVLLCRAHHTIIHTTPWQVGLNPIDRKPEFVPPTRIDPLQRPTRQRRPRE